MSQTITIPKESFADLAAILPLGAHVFIPCQHGPDRNVWNPKAKSPLHNLLALAGQKSSTVSSLSLTFEDIHETGAVLVSVIDHHSTWPEYTFPADRAGGIHRAATTYQQEADKAKNAPKATLCPCLGYDKPLALTPWEKYAPFSVGMSSQKHLAVFFPLTHPETGAAIWCEYCREDQAIPHRVGEAQAKGQSLCHVETCRQHLHKIQTTLEPLGSMPPAFLAWILGDAETVRKAYADRHERYKANLDREQKEREERRQSAKAEALAKLETDWAEGRPIPRDAFEDKAKAAGYSWNIRTLGAYRKAVASVSRAGSVTFGHKTGKLPAGVSCAIFEAIQAIASKTAETGGAQ